jgi:hypothetical protein
MDATDEDPAIDESTDPLLPLYKDSYPPSDSRSTGPIHLGEGKVQTRRRRAFVFTAFTICAALLLVLATPLVLLWQRGLFVNGVHEALLGGKPNPGAFPTE